MSNSALARYWRKAVAAGAEFLSLHWIRDTWMYLVRILERMEDNHIFLSGAGIAFNSFLCFIPLVLIIFYVLGLYFDSESAIRTIDGYLDSLQMFPYERDYLRTRVLGLVREFVTASPLAGLIGLVGLAWASQALFAALRTVLNNIFNIRDTKSIVVSKLKDLALLSIVGFALVIITILSYGMTVVKGIAQGILGGEPVHWLIEGSALHISSAVLSFLLFCVVFWLVPDKRLPLRAIALSSAIAAVLWAVAKAVFSYYVANLWSIGKVYGPYAIIVATAVWVYYSSVTLLLAAEIGEMYIERSRLKSLFREKGMRSIIASLHEPDLGVHPSRPEDDA